MKRFATLLAGIMFAASALILAPTTALAATDMEDCTFDISWSIRDYNGTNQAPTLTVKDGSTTLQEGVDYTVTIYRHDDWVEGNPLTEAVDAGEYYFKINGIGAYEGIGFKPFEIHPLDVFIFVFSGVFPLSIF